MLLLIRSCESQNVNLLFDEDAEKLPLRIILNATPSELVRPATVLPQAFTILMLHFVFCVCFSLEGKWSQHVNQLDTLLRAFFFNELRHMTQPRSQVRRFSKVTYNCIHGVNTLECSEKGNHYTSTMGHCRCCGKTSQAWWSHSKSPQKSY